jgi:hypothetical protein
LSGDAGRDAGDGAEDPPAGLVAAGVRIAMETLINS